MKSTTDKPSPPTSPGPGSPSLRPTFESIKPSPRRSSSSHPSSSTRRSSRVSSTSSSAVQSIPEKGWHQEKERTLSGKITHGAKKVLGAACYLLFLCCVLDGEKPGQTQPKRTRTNSSTSSRHVADTPRARKNSHASSKACSERIERA